MGDSGMTPDDDLRKLIKQWRDEAPGESWSEVDHSKRIVLETCADELEELVVDE